MQLLYGYKQYKLKLKDFFSNYERDKHNTVIVINTTIAYIELD